MTVREPYDLEVEEIITIATIETDRTWRITNFFYEDICVLCYAISGNATCSWDDQTREIAQGDVLYFPTMKSRSTYSSPQMPWKFVVTKFRMKARNQTTQTMLANLPVYIGNVRGPVAGQFIKLEAVWRGKQPGHIVKCKSILYDLLAQLLITPYQTLDTAHYQAYLKPVFEAMEQNIRHNYSVPELAGIAKLSPSYFRAIFKQYSGYTPIQYQHYIKMAHAHDLLRMNLYSISEVAAMVGFHDYYYFSRLFKQVIGIPPSKV